LITKNSIVLKKKEDIEGYVLQLIKDYFRTTYKSKVTLDSDLHNHGLDSLDYLELAM